MAAQPGKEERHQLVQVIDVMPQRRHPAPRHVAQRVTSRARCAPSPDQTRLPGSQALPGRSLQHLKLSIVMGTADLLHIPRPAPRRMDDLRARRTRRGLNSPHIRGHQPSRA